MSHFKVKSGLKNTFTPTLLAVGLTFMVGTTTVCHAKSGSPSETISTSTDSVAQTATPTKKLNLSPIFIQLSDAMSAIKIGDTVKAKADLTTIQSDFNAILQATNTQSSPLGQKTSQAIDNALANPSSDSLNQVSTDLYAFEKAQNPVDVTAQRQEFSKKVMPAFDNLNTAVTTATASPTADTIAALQDRYQQFGNAWKANEKIVKNNSMGHYGKIETAVALIRVGLETPTAGQSINLPQIQTQTSNLKQALDSFNTGKTVTAAPTGFTLNSGIALLQDGLVAFQSGDNAAGQSKLGEFISIWPSIEGDVSTRNPALYSKVETQVPVVMANGGNPKQQQNLQAIINELNQINPQAQYSWVDSMLILLREGLEALLIVMALLSALTAAKQPKGKKWVVMGMAFGLLASVLGAMALQRLFPTMTAGASREMFEGVIGIVAVVMMLGIGAWLHSKSSVKSWNNYIKRHMGEALTTGSFVSLFGLAFLSVFREGAETIIFYVGILPNISTADFLLGIGMALAILAGVAFIMLKTSVKLPIPTLFKVLTWIVYLLGFKILGVSIHLLQMTGYVTMGVIPSLPAVSALGIYPTVQTLLAQFIYILAIIALTTRLKQQEKVENLAVST